MNVPKYVGQYFPAGKRTSKESVIKRFCHLEKSRFGYKTTEYKYLKRYLKTYLKKIPKCKVK